MFPPLGYKLYELAYCVAGDAQRNSAIEDDLFRQGPAPRFSSLHAVITMLFHASLNIHGIRGKRLRFSVMPGAFFK